MPLSCRDAIAAHGFAHELANYGEYSGAPTQTQTYEYAKTIRASSPPSFLPFCIESATLTSSRPVLLLAALVLSQSTS